MASEAHNVKKQKILHIEGCPVDLPRKRISSSTKKIMKEGKKSPKQLASYTNRITVGKTVTSPLSLFKVVYCKRKVHCYSPKPCYRKKQLPKSRGCDMANKENELACAGNLPAKLHIDSSTYLLNSSDSRSSQTEDPSSKFSGFFSEISQDHETMNQVLFSRNLRLNVALTFWRRRSINELVAYLLRIQDLGVLVDCLPVLTNSLQEENPYVSVGCCVDLFPLVKSLLNSKYEEYVIVGLNWLQAVIKTWWSELSAHTEKAEDGNTHILKKQLSGLWEQMNHLTLVPGYTGNIAKVGYQELQYVRNLSIWCDLMKVAVRKDLKQTLSYVQDLSELEKTWRVHVLLKSEGTVESIILLLQNLSLCIKQDVKAYLLQLH